MPAKMSSLFKKGNEMIKVELLDRSAQVGLSRVISRVGSKRCQEGQGGEHC